MSSSLERKINRTPKKKLNPFIKANLLAILKRPDITVDTRASSAGTGVLNVKEINGTPLFSFINSWDYGQYSIKIGDTVVAEMEWRENDMHTNPDQQDIFDVLKAIGNKQKEIKRIENAKKTLTAEEKAALAVLGVRQK